MITRGIFPEKALTMQGETKHIWVDLCAEAAICEDPTRLKLLAVRIGEILQKEQQRLGAGMPPTSSEESTMRGRDVA